jgi:hypothetical protein
LEARKGSLRIVEGIYCEAIAPKALLKDIRNVRFIIHYGYPFHEYIKFLEALFYSSGSFSYPKDIFLNCLLFAVKGSEDLHQDRRQG